jgi:callose synthase
MSGVEKLWERLVWAALSRERTGAGNNVPSALAKNRDHIEEILCVVDEIGDDDPTISRICMYISI